MNDMKGFGTWKGEERKSASFFVNNIKSIIKK